MNRFIKIKALVEVEIYFNEELAKFYLPDEKIDFNKGLSEDMTKECLKAGMFEDSDLSEKLGNLQRDKIQIISSEIVTEKEDDS